MSSSSKNPNSGGGGGNNQNGGASADKTKKVQNEVDEVVGIMNNNINKVMERGEKLDSLQTKTGIILIYIL